jgi:hypothetical protein
MAATCIVATTAGPVAADIGPNQCIDIDGTNLNDLYHTNDAFLSPDAGCNTAYMGSKLRPVAHWGTALTYEIAPPDYEPLGATPAEDFVAKVESMRFVVDSGSPDEATFLVDAADLFVDTAILFDTIELVRVHARLPGLHLGQHFIEVYGTLSADHWDGLGLEDSNHLPGGEFFWSFIEVVVTRPLADPKGPPSPETPKLRIELTWDTTADLDLHLLHPNGDWNEAPWDCYWANRNPNWGLPFSSDDPELEVDDIDGFGPEVITLPRLEHVTYQVGVLSFSGARDVTTTATVRVFDENELVAEITTEFPGPRHFWTVAGVALGGSDITVTPSDVIEPVS